MNRQRLLAALARPAAARGVVPALAALRPQFDLHIFDALPSTNTHAWRLVEAGAGAGTVVIARQQQAGRGQWGRQWISAPGGLYLTLVLEPAMAEGDRGLLTLASAWGIAAALGTFAVPVQIKWPNDLVSQGRKLGGLLAETRSSSRPAAGLTQGSPAIVGVGLNWANPVPETGITLATLLPTPAPAGLTCLEDVAAVVLRGILQGQYLWQQQGAAALIAAYQQKWRHQGQSITLNGDPGRIVGITQAGNLLVELEHPSAKITRCLSPGEISLGY